jgi:hypothetical protein
VKITETTVKMGPSVSWDMTVAIKAGNVRRTLNLGHDRRRPTGTIDANKSIRRKLAGDFVRGLCRLAERTHGNMESNQKPSREFRAQQRSARHALANPLNAGHKGLL